MPFERARTLLVQGRILRRLKQKREGARRARPGGADLRAPRRRDVDGRRSNAELRRLATRRAPDALTPTERRIAEPPLPDSPTRRYPRASTCRGRPWRRTWHGPTASLASRRARNSGRHSPGTPNHFRREPPLSAATGAAVPSIAMEGERESFVAECYWPDVDDADLATLDRRIEHVIAELAPATRGSVSRLDSPARGRGGPLPVRGTRGQRPRRRRTGGGLVRAHPRHRPLALAAFTNRRIR